MNKFLATFILAFCALLMPSGSQAACVPSSPAVVRVGFDAGAFWAYWFCTDTGTVTAQIRVLPVDAIDSATVQKLQAYATGSLPSFAAEVPALPASAPSIAPAFAIAAAKAASDPGKPASIAEVWKSAGTGTLYTVAAGKLSAVISGRKVPVGTLLDCSTVKIGSTYCPISGGVATEVTLAKKVSP